MFLLESVGGQSVIHLPEWFVFERSCDLETSNFLPGRILYRGLALLKNILKKNGDYQLCSTTWYQCVSNVSHAIYGALKKERLCCHMYETTLFQSLCLGLNTTISGLCDQY